MNRPTDLDDSRTPASSAASNPTSASNHHVAPSGNAGDINSEAGSENHVGPEDANDPELIEATIVEASPAALEASKHAPPITDVYVLEAADLLTPEGEDRHAVEHAAPEPRSATILPSEGAPTTEVDTTDVGAPESPQTAESPQADASTGSDLDIPEADAADDIVFLAPAAEDDQTNVQAVYAASAISPPVRVVDAKPVPPAPRPHFVVRVFMFVGGCAEWMFGVASLMIGLAIVASIPILQFASLGYLLEASGRVARSGRVRDAFMGVKSAARIGGLVLGAWLVYSPLLLINEMWYSSYLIDPDSNITGAWRVGQLIATILIVVHVVVSWFNGGRLRDYFWPLAAPVAVPWNLVKGRGLVVSIPPLRILTEIGRGGMLARRRDAVWDFLVDLQLPHLFWLGLRGFAGAVAWLFVPIMLLAIASTLPPGGAVLLSLAGAALLTVVLLYLPFLQTQFAMQGEMVAMFDLPKVREKFRKAPIAFWFSLLITLLFAVPLYLLKIELTPQEMLWIPSLVFVAFMFPARVLCGWVLGLASRREQPRHFIFRFFSRLAQVPIVLAYVGIVYLTQYLSWYGVWSLFEQHAFLTPAPFLGG